MPGLQELTASQITQYRGPRFGLDEPTACFHLTLKGEEPSAPELARLLGFSQALWGHMPPPHPYERWLEKALERSQCAGDLCLHEWVAALTVALQWLAMIPVGRARLLRKESEPPRIAVPWLREEVLHGAISWSLRLTLHWMKPDAKREAADDSCMNGLRHWITEAGKNGCDPISMRFALAARELGIPAEPLSGSLLRLGWGCHSRIQESSFSGSTSAVAARIARNKPLTNQLLAKACIPTPPGGTAHTPDQAVAIVQQLGWPVVVKPVDQDKGLGVTPFVRDLQGLSDAIRTAVRYSPDGILVERHVPGEDHRILVVGGRALMCVRRRPASVIGDGLHTVRQLLGSLNADPRRGNHPWSQLRQVPADDELLRLVRQQGLDLDDVPAAGRSIVLRLIANINAGGTAEDLSAVMHPDNAALAVRAAATIGLDIAGVDFLCPDIRRSWREVGGWICEVNGQPGLRVNTLAAPSRRLYHEILGWMFPGGTGRIPTAVITGTNGKTTAARLLHYMWRQAGLCTGLACTTGIWINDEELSRQDLSGEAGARVILTDRRVEAAVIELPRKGLLGIGHACDHYDVSLLTNVQNDHLGEFGIETLEQMAGLKAEVLERTTGAVVVNAEDPLCLGALSRAGTTRHVLVARNPGHPALAAHLARGGEAVFTEERDGRSWLVVASQGRREALLPLAEIPATMNGLLAFNELNAMNAVGLALVLGIGHEAMRTALRHFEASPAYNPGRYNFIPGLPFTVVLDFAHNNDGQAELCRIARSLPCASRKRLVTTLTANRHAENMEFCAPLFAKSFDSVLMSTDADTVLKNPVYQGEAGPQTIMLERSRRLLLEAGLSPEQIGIEPAPDKAILRALAETRPGDLLIILADPFDGLRLVQEFKNSLAV
jgi:cyanophycin synthetase